VAGKLVTACLPDVAASQAPMEALRSLVSLASADDPDKNSNSPEANARKAVRLTAQQPLLVAAYHAARSGRELPPPAEGLGLAANFLLQMRGTPPAEHEAEVLDTCLVLHADHTMNASTFAARVCAATLSDMHSAVVAAIGTLKGPLHGGANEQVMRTLTEIRSTEPGDPVGAVEREVMQRLAAGEKIMGFGHRVYKTEDPRATHLRAMSGGNWRGSPATTPSTACPGGWRRSSWRKRACCPTSTSTPPPSITTWGSRPTFSPASSRSAGWQAGRPT